MKTLKLNNDLELIIGSFGAIQSLLLSFYFFIGRHKILHNLLLSLLFFFLTIRVAKSILWMNFESIPNIILNIGFISHSLIAPLFWLYIKYYISNKKWEHRDYLHFVPTLCLLIFVFQINENNFWYLGGYSSLLIHQIIYTTFIIIYFINLVYNKGLIKSYHNIKYVWLLVLSLGIIGIQFSYFSNYILGITPYSVAPILYSLLIFVIALFGFIYANDLFRGKSKYEHIKLEKNQINMYMAKIERYFNDKKPYLESNFNLNKLSEAVFIQPYIISYLINHKYGSNFSEFVNSYRIAETQKRLSEKEFMNIKISEIAYDCGFNSLTAFNLSFKKIANCTPSQFRMKVIKSY